MSLSDLEIFTGFYKTPTNLGDKGIRWVNVIADMLLPQRATLFGWAVLFAALFLLYRGRFVDAIQAKRRYINDNYICDDILHSTV